MAYSNGAGGTLTISSPTHVHSVDVGSAVRSLRRSLSRSPSKFHLVRSDSHMSHTSDSSTSSFYTPSPDSPSPRFDQSGAPGNRASASPAVAAAAPTPLQSELQISTPLRSSLKLSLRSTRPKTTSKAAPRTRVSPRSPLKRALSSSSDTGNAAVPFAPAPPPQYTGPPTAMSEPLLGQENTTALAASKFSSFLLSFASSTSRAAHNKPSRHSMHLDLSDSNHADVLASTVTSPLKRSDVTMDFDQANPGSPVAKRRSLHGISSLGLDSDFSVFDFASPNTAPPARTSFEIHEDSNFEASNAVPENALTPSVAAPIETHSSAMHSVMQKRSSSLRKSTLQQRHDPRSSWGRRQGERYLALQQQQQQQQQDQPAQQPEQKQPHQHQHQQPQQQTLPQSLQTTRSPADWCFTAPHVRSKPRASLDQILRPEGRESPFKVVGPLPNPSAHVLEPTSSAATATSGATAAANAHQPHPLSRTLTTSSSSSSLPDDSPTHFPVQLPLDRPRPTSIFARSLPLNAHRPRPDPSNTGTPQYKSARPLQSVFASAGLVSKMHRSTEDDALQRGFGRPMAMPDTPCKKQVYPSNTYPPSCGSGRKQQHQNRRFFFSAAPETPFNTDPAMPRGASTGNANENVVNFFKLRSSHTRKGSILSIDGDASDSQGNADGFDLPPTPTKSVLVKNLFGSGSKGHTASPIAIRDLSMSAAGDSARPAPINSSIARFSQVPLPISSPSGSSSSEAMSPKTPRESSVIHNLEFSSSMPPPYAGGAPAPSNLDLNRGSSTLSRKKSIIFPPATPTTDREALASFMDRRVSITPVHGAEPTDSDALLTAMFGKIECVGRGEFSQVFRVTKQNGTITGSADYFSSTPSKRASLGSTAAASGSSSSGAAQIFAVKKIRLPYFGQKTRESKLREVAVLEAVRNRDNVLQIYDHWEQNGHLYIQTEFCEEGGLDNFLKKVGEHGRLDDFRIWKILLEVTQGLRYVHDAGFIHLDLKPANIFVTFEGHLKIGDFGMAMKWPAPKGIEGEGDREYIGPEILQGKYDKPADVFSLGLIVLEIACNVFLPDNGRIWVALREGDMSVVPSLTAGEANALLRDSVGMPIVTESEQPGATSSAVAQGGSFSLAAGSQHGQEAGVGAATGRVLDDLAGHKTIGLATSPLFMANQHHPGSLDSVVSWLINPDPACRPTVHQILEIDSLKWVHARRRAPATVYEGNWGPESDDERALAATTETSSNSGSSGEVDTEMTDV